MKVLSLAPLVRLCAWRLKSCLVHSLFVGAESACQLTGIHVMNILPGWLLICATRFVPGLERMGVLILVQLCWFLRLLAQLFILRSLLWCFSTDYNRYIVIWMFQYFMFVEDSLFCRGSSDKDKERAIRASFKNAFCGQQPLSDEVRVMVKV